VTKLVRLTPAAESDLVEHYRYIAADNPTAAEFFFDAVQSFCELVADNPGIGATRDCGRAGALRMFPLPGFRNWMVFYRNADDHVLVLRILHAKRDFPTLFGE